MKYAVRLLALTLCLVMTVVAFASCEFRGSSFLKEEKLTENDTHNTYAVTSFTDFADYMMHGESGTTGKVALLSKTETNGTSYRCVDLSTGAVILTVPPMPDTTTTCRVTDEFIIVSQTPTAPESKTTHTVYDLHGSQVFSTVKSLDTGVWYGKNYYYFDETIYYFTDEGNYDSSRNVAWPSVNGVPFESSAARRFVATEKGFITYTVNTSNAQITFYDLDFMPTGTYSTPAEVTEPRVFILEGGSAVIQYLVALPFDADRYDFTQDAMKADVVQLLVKPDGDTKKLDYDGLLESAYACDEDSYYDMANFASLRPIEDKTLMGDTYVYYCELKNNGSLGATLPKIGGMLTEYAPFAPGYYYGSAEADNERVYLFDEKGKAVGNISGVVDATDKYLITATGIYDLTLARVFSFEAADYTYVFDQTLGSGVLLTVTNPVSYEVAHYLYTGGTAPTQIDVINTWVTAIRDDFYILRDAQGAMILYQADGTAVPGLPTFSQYAYIASQDGNYLFVLTATDGSTSVYYLKGN